MTTSRLEILERAVALARMQRTRRGHAGFTTTDAAALSVTATGLPPAGTSPSAFTDHWVWLPAISAADDQSRVVDSYDPATRTVPHKGPAYGAGTIAEAISGTPLLIVRDDPRTWEAALDEALRTLVSEVAFEEFTPDGSHRYELDVDDLTRVTQIAEVDVQVGDLYEPWSNGLRTWDAYTEGRTIVLDFGRIAPTADQPIRIKYTAQLDPDDFDVDLELAAYAVLVQMGLWLRDPDNASDDWNVIFRQATLQYNSTKRRVLGGDAYGGVVRPAQRGARLVVRGRYR